MILVMLLSKHSCKIYHVCILIYLCTPFVYTIPDVDRDIYEEGKKQYRTITEHSKYGPCWKDTLIKLEKGCKEITDTVQLKLAVHYLNCFLDMQNRTIYPCDDRDDTVHCTQNLSDTDRTSLTTFFAHTYSICYFIRAHSWHDETVRTMEQLLHNSQKVTSQLEYLSTLQNQMIAKQSETLKIQDDVLNKSSNINITLSDKILPFLNELNETAHLHKEYTSSVYADILNMFRSVFGKYNWIYSVISHVPFAFAIFIVTGTEETRVARPWMIFVLLLNFFIEVFIFGFAIQVFSWIPQGIYTQLHNVCRIAAVMSIIVIWMVFCIRYRKIPDNHMLENMHEDIKKLRQAFEEFHKSMQNQLPAGSSGVTGQNPTQDSGSVTSKTTPRRKTRTPIIDDMATSSDENRFAERNEKFIFSMLKSQGIKTYDCRIYGNLSDTLRNVPDEFQCGIYVFYLTNTVSKPHNKFPIYVGQTAGSFKNRFRSHDAIKNALTFWPNMYLFAFIAEIPHAVASFMESFLLDQFDFSLNKTNNDDVRTKFDQKYACTKTQSATMLSTEWQKLTDVISDLNKKFSKMLK